MPRQDHFWTKQRIHRLEQALAAHQNDIFAEAFLAKLSQCHTTEQKRALIVDEFLPAMRTESMTQLHAGQEIPMHFALRDIIQDFLYREQITDNIPTNEPDTPEDHTERDRLARLFSSGEPVSEMVAEDRGPR